MTEFPNASLVESDASLVWLVVLPLLACVAATVAALRRARSAPFSLVALVALVALGCWALSLVLGLAAAARLVSRAHALIDPAFAVLRVGQLDLDLALTVDRTTVVVLVTLQAVALASAWSAFRANVPASRVAWSSLLGAGASLVVLGDAWPTVSLGLALSLAGGWGLGGGGSFARLWFALAGDGVIVLGAMLLFWVLGGDFTSSGYTPDAEPNFAVLPTGSWAGGKALITFGSHAGVSVVAHDGPPLSGEPLYAPFAYTIDPGRHSLRIEQGIAFSEQILLNVTFEPNHSYALVPIGPSLSQRTLVDERRRARRGDSDSLSRRTLLGIPASPIVGCCFAFGALARIVFCARRRKIQSPMMSLEGIPPTVVALRAVVLDPGELWGQLLALGFLVTGFLLALDGVDTSPVTQPPHATLDGPGCATGLHDEVPRRVPFGLIAGLSAVAVGATTAGALSGVALGLATSMGACALCFWRPAARSTHSDPGAIFPGVLLVLVMVYGLLGLGHTALGPAFLLPAFGLAFAVARQRVSCSLPADAWRAWRAWRSWRPLVLPLGLAVMGLVMSCIGPDLLFWRSSWDETLAMGALPSGSGHLWFSGLLALTSVAGWRVGQQRHPIPAMWSRLAARKSLLFVRSLSLGALALRDAVAVTDGRVMHAAPTLLGRKLLRGAHELRRLEAVFEQEASSYRRRIAAAFAVRIGVDDASGAERCVLGVLVGIMAVAVGIVLCCFAAA